MTKAGYRKKNVFGLRSQSVSTHHGSKACSKLQICCLEPELRVHVLIHKQEVERKHNRNGKSVLKSQCPHTSCKKAAASNLSQTVTPSGDQLFKLMNLSGAILKLPHSTPRTPVDLWPYHNAKYIQFNFRSPHSLSPLQHNLKTQSSKSLQTQGNLLIIAPWKIKSKLHTLSVQWHRMY